MSMYLEFEPHSWYMGFAIKDDRNDITEKEPWTAFTLNGMTGFIDTVSDALLVDLKYKIRQYHLDKHNGYGERVAKRRLEYLRGEIEAERISYGEISELESLTPYIANDDVQLLQWANVPEGEV